MMQVGKTLRFWVLGQLVDMLAVGVLSGVGMAVLGVGARLPLRGVASVCLSHLVRRRRFIWQQEPPQPRLLPNQVGQGVAVQHGHEGLPRLVQYIPEATGGHDGARVPDGRLR